MKEKVLSVGMNAFIIKPFEPARLFSLIKFYTAKGKMSKVELVEEEKLPEVPAIAITSGELDFSYLKDLAQGDAEFISGMLQLFVEQTPIELQQLHKNVEEEDWEMVKKQAHKLKYPFSSIGRNDLSNLLGEIEQIQVEAPNKEQIHVWVETLAKGAETTMKQIFSQSEFAVKKS